MSTEKKNLTSKIKAHFATNKEGYTKLGYYMLGVTVSAGLYIVFETVLAKEAAAEWDAAELWNLTNVGDGALTFIDRDGNFGYFKPDSIQN